MLILPLLFGLPQLILNVLLYLNPAGVLSCVAASYEQKRVIFMVTLLMEVIGLRTRAGEAKARFRIGQNVVPAREAVRLAEVEHLAGLDVHQGIGKYAVLTAQNLHRRALQREIFAGFDAH